MKLTGPFSIKGMIAGGIVLVASFPLLFVVYSALGVEADRWASLWNTRIPELLWNTMSLAVSVSLVCLLLGVSSAWLVARRRFPGRTLATWLMVLPLAVPAYVLAHVYTTLLQPGGTLARIWETVTLGVVPVPDLYNLAGATFILSLAGFSYVFLLTRAALAGTGPTLEQAARIAGAGPLRTFWQISLPLLRPALAAAVALIVLHVLSDFGAVSLLRFQTFTLSIYLQISGRMDYSGAAALSLVLVLLSLAFLIVERAFRTRQRYFSRSLRGVPDLPPRATRLEMCLIWGWLGLIAMLAFGVPLLWMLHWSWQAWLGGALDGRFWGYAMNSLTIAAAAGVITVIAALPIGLFHLRRRNWVSQMFLHVSSVGFVLPGPVIALGVLVFALTVLSPLYGTLAALIFALVVRFLPLAVQSEEAALQQLTPALEQAGRNLGAGSLENLWRVILPLIRPGVASAFVLVFIDVLKELPATLILRPVGFDTLPVRIWIEASEEMLEVAAPAALMLVLASLPAIWVLMRLAPQESPARRTSSGARVAGPQPAYPGLAGA